MKKGAKFSDCGKYRYQLWRIWDESRPLVQLIGLNPSTANADTDDPTIRRITSLVNKNGYGGFYMTNLFGLISPYPKDLESGDPFGDNEKWLAITRTLVQDVVYCWGNFWIAQAAIDSWSQQFLNPLCFGQNKSGSPKHPLYLKSGTKLKRFIEATNQN